MSAFFLIFMDQILALIGVSAATWNLAKSYLTTVSLCGLFVLIGNCFSNILRVEGQPNKAMMGMLMGNLLNVILDPVMILLLGWNITGAAIATVIGNVMGALYYIIYFLTAIITNGIMADYGDMAIAGIGVGIKVTMITGMIALELGKVFSRFLGIA